MLLILVRKVLIKVQKNKLLILPAELVDIIVKLRSHQTQMTFVPEWPISGGETSTYLQVH